MKKLAFPLLLLIFSCQIALAENPIKKPGKGWYIGASADVYNVFWTNFGGKDFDDLFLPNGGALKLDYNFGSKFSFSSNVNFMFSPATRRIAPYQEYLNLKNSRVFGFDMLLRYTLPTRFGLHPPYGRYLGFGYVFKNAEVFIPKTFGYEFNNEKERYELTSIDAAEYYKGRASGPSFTYGYMLPMGRNIIFDMGFQFTFLLFRYENGIGEAADLPTDFIFDRNLTKAYYRILIPIQ
ncbi:MAG: hypothetical protein ACPGLV_01615 [Bacteroidia bacterium]